MKLPVKLQKLVEKKGKKKIAMLTCYDYSFAQILDEAGLDIILVGDSLANVILGLETTKEIGFREMFEHTRAVCKGVKQSVVVADMPYVSYQKNPKKAVYFAKKFIEEAGADAVKVEWFPQCVEVVRDLVKNHLPVMGHIGLTPQRVDKLGGFRVQGRNWQEVKNLLTQAKFLEKAGVFSLVLECIPRRVARLITQNFCRPTIGIGAGPFCDGQVLVLYDLLGLYRKKKARFVKVYQDLWGVVKSSVEEFIREVKNGEYPKKEHSFFIKDEEWRRLQDSP